MAEVFGVGAGVVGVVSLTVQLYDQSRKVATFLKSVKGFPDEIQGMLEQLETLMSTLARARSLFPKDSKASLKLGNQVTRDCQELTSLLRKLHDNIQQCASRAKSRLYWRSIKAAMRKDEIKQMSSRIRRACTLLQTVNQVEFQ